MSHNCHIMIDRESISFVIFPFLPKFHFSFPFPFPSTFPWTWWLKNNQMMDAHLPALRDMVFCCTPEPLWVACQHTGSDRQSSPSLNSKQSATAVLLRTSPNTIATVSLSMALGMAEYCTLESWEALGGCSDFSPQLVLRSHIAHISTHCHLRMLRCIHSTPQPPTRLCTKK